MFYWSFLDLVDIGSLDIECVELFSRRLVSNRCVVFRLWFISNFCICILVVVLES